MQQRQVGRSGLRVTLVGLGCNNFGWKIDQQASAAVIAKALDVGINFFDTADCYGNPPGQSEIFLGKALGARRKDIVLLSKFGMDLKDLTVRNSSRRYVMSAVEDSLRRLGTDWLDIYMIHWPDYGTPMEETLKALDDLVRAGKVRYIGCSNLEAWRVVDAMWISRYFNLASFIAVQNHYNLLNRNIEKDLLPALKHFGAGLIPYFPLASGLLTGKYSGGVNNASGRLQENWLGMRDTFVNERNLKIVNALEVFCRQRGRTLLELAISWLAAQEPVATIICGATTPEQVEQNVKAANWTLTPEELAEVDRLTQGA
jgi:aryl-alcohol dehydrogenase-like predicted oxidoreductase